jgi:hypothetical protein
MTAFRLRFSKDLIKSFCIRRAIYVLKDFDKIPEIKSRAAYARKTQELFQCHAREFMEKQGIVGNAFLDGVQNIERFIPLVTICFVFEEEFLVYDIFTHHFYTYENGRIFLNDKQIIETSNSTRLDLPCESLNVCRYLLRLTPMTTVEDSSLFYKFVRHYL